MKALPTVFSNDENFDETVLDLAIGSKDNNLPPKNRECVHCFEHGSLSCALSHYFTNYAPCCSTI